MNLNMRPKLMGILLVSLATGLIFALGDRSQVIESFINYPNPFDSRKEETIITYRLPQDYPVRLKIFDLFGYPVKEFYFTAGEMGGRSGVNTIRWDGTNGNGDKVSKGGYVCQVLVEANQPVQGIRKIGVIH